MKIAGTLLAGFSALAFFAPGSAHAGTEGAEAFAAPTEVAPAMAKPPVSPQDNCSENSCHVRLTADQLLKKTQEFVAQKDYALALPMAQALGQAPGYELESRYLIGFIAVEHGDLNAAEAQFRAILEKNPKQTRVRLELGRVMLMKGKNSSADYHFRLAAEDKDLPPEIAKTIRNVRSVLRDKRIWRFNFNLGIAPDSNINSATSAETVNINFGPFELPLTLDPNARKKSGIGQTGGFSAGLRVKATDKIAILIDSDARFVNYEGKFADDVQLQMAAGPELRISSTSSVSIQGLAEQRWYGGRVANRDFGGRVGFQQVLDEGQRVGVEIDGRHTDSHFSPAYSGWLVGGNVTYERIVAGTFIASVSAFGRKDMLESAAYSNHSYGASVGIGGELPFGVNGGVTASVSRAKFDAPQYIYSNDRRDDLRFFGRATLGMRSVSLLGFSPSVEYNFTKIDSNYDLYESTRHRVNFKLARYF